MNRGSHRTATLAVWGRFFFPVNQLVADLGTVTMLTLDGGTSANFGCGRGCARSHGPYRSLSSPDRRQRFGAPPGRYAHRVERSRLLSCQVQRPAAHPPRTRQDPPPGCRRRRRPQVARYPFSHLLRAARTRDEHGGACRDLHVVVAAPTTAISSFRKARPPTTARLRRISCTRSILPSRVRYDDLR
jgi:hypothetical protein